jgi:hypothetical protein
VVEAEQVQKLWRWKLRLAMNRLRGRGDGYCWWCGSPWDGERCPCCGMVVLGSGTVEGVYRSSGEEIRGGLPDALKRSNSD